MGLHALGQGQGVVEALQVFPEAFMGTRMCFSNISEAFSLEIRICTPIIKECANR